MKRRNGNLDSYYQCEFYNDEKRGCGGGRCDGFGFLYGKAHIHVNRKKGNSQLICMNYVSEAKAMQQRISNGRNITLVVEKIGKKRKEIGE